MELYFEIAGGQIDGARDYQEDAFLTTFVDDDEGGPKSAALVVMADGMGGHAAGNIASNLVVSTFNQCFTKFFGKRDVSSILRDALIQANNGLSESIRETPALDGMGCTMVSGAFCKSKVWWASVGDSHLYLLRDRELIKKNEDHSYGGYLDRMAAQGMQVEPEPGLSRNMLMSAMTGEDIAEIDCPGEPLELRPGDRIIVASDGLDTLSQGTIIQMSTWSATARECVEALLKAVEDAGKPRQDNTTVVVVDALARDKVAPAPALAPEPPSTDVDDADATQPLRVEDIQAALQAERSQREQDYAEQPGSSRGGLLTAIVVVLLLALAGGGYYLYSQGYFATEAPEPVPGPAQAPPSPAEGPAPTGEETMPKPDEAPVPAAVEETPPKPVVAATGEFRDALRSGGQGPMMVGLPGGSFRMGGTELAAPPDERPARTVRVRPFAIGKYEVTIGEYRRFAEATGRGLPRGVRSDKATLPITLVTWSDALDYTKWLSEQTGHQYRLPSEAEWEYAARAGSEEPYPWGYRFQPRKAHCFDCDTGLDPRQPTDVGRFEANALGLHDTVGNVSEWVYDCYHPTYDGAPSDAVVWEGGDCGVRVARGGAFGSPSTALKSSKRSKFKPEQRLDTLGLRVVRER